MMKIVHRHTKEVLYRSEDAETVRDAVVMAVANRADLSYADLYDAGLYEAPLRGAKLLVADLHLADLRYADLHCADLRYADLCGATLNVTDLHGADLRGASLHTATLRYADLRYADLRHAHLHGADMLGAQMKSGRIAKLLGSGDGTFYPWRAWLMEDGSTVLVIGCIEKPLKWWRENAEELAAKHDGSAPRIHALVAWVEALRAAGERDGDG